MTVWEGGEWWNLEGLHICPCPRPGDTESRIHMKAQLSYQGPRGVGDKKRSETSSRSSMEHNEVHTGCTDAHQRGGHVGGRAWAMGTDSGDDERGKQIASPCFHNPQMNARASKRWRQHQDLPTPKTASCSLEGQCMSDAGVLGSCGGPVRNTGNKHRKAAKSGQGRVGIERRGPVGRPQGIGGIGDEGE